MKQTTFASAAWEREGKITLALTEPHYPKAGNGTQPLPMERMLRIYFM
jgi:hypothetical protein